MLNRTAVIYGHDIVVTRGLQRGMYIDMLFLATQYAAGRCEHMGESFYGVKIFWN